MPLKLLSGLIVRCTELSPFAKKNEFSSYILRECLIFIVTGIDRHRSTGYRSQKGCFFPSGCCVC